MKTQHGTLHAYATKKCRCKACKDTWNAYYRNRRYQQKTTQALRTIINRHVETSQNP
jgi:hypothetical protein